MSWLLWVLGACVYLLIGVLALGYVNGRCYAEFDGMMASFTVMMWPLVLLILLCIELICYGPIYKIYKFAERLGEKVREKREEEED